MRERSGEEERRSARERESMRAREREGARVRVYECTKRKGQINLSFFIVLNEIKPILS